MEYEKAVEKQKLVSFLNESVADLYHAKSTWWEPELILNPV